MPALTLSGNLSKRYVYTFEGTLSCMYVHIQSETVYIRTCVIQSNVLHVPLLFQQFQQMLMHRAQKRMQNSLSLNEISPHLAAISSSCISMPGLNQGDEVCIHILLLYMYIYCCSMCTCTLGIHTCACVCTSFNRAFDLERSRWSWV